MSTTIEPATDKAIAASSPGRTNEHKLTFEPYQNDTGNFYATMEREDVVFCAEVVLASVNDVLQAIKKHGKTLARQYVQSLIDQSEHAATIEILDVDEEVDSFSFCSINNVVQIAFSLRISAQFTTNKAAVAA